MSNPPDAYPPGRGQVSKDDAPPVLFKKIGGDPDHVRVVFLVGFDPGLYHECAVASATEYGISRHAALRKMLRPFAGMASHLG